MKSPKRKRKGSGQRRPITSQRSASSHHDLTGYRAPPNALEQPGPARGMKDISMGDLTRYEVDAEPLAQMRSTLPMERRSSLNAAPAHQQSSRSWRKVA
jgi:hypothetical protein